MEKNKKSEGNVGVYQMTFDERKKEEIRSKFNQLLMGISRGYFWYDDKNNLSILTELIKTLNQIYSEEFLSWLSMEISQENFSDINKGNYRLGFIEAIRRIKERIEKFKCSEVS